MRIKFFIGLCAFLLNTLMGYSQNEIVHVYGQLKDQITKKKLEDVTVQVFKDGALFDNFNAGKSGKYDLSLPLGPTYDIKFSKTGEFLSKTIRIDTKNIPAEERMGGFDMNVDGTLFAYREGFNTDLLKEPMAKAKYDPAGDGFGFDSEFTEKRMKAIEEEFKRLDDLDKNKNKAREDFDKFVKAGDDNVIKKVYADAITNYEQALALFPNEEPVKVKLADAKTKRDAENAAKGAEAEYKKLLKEGDDFFAAKKYSEAKGKFQKAKDMRNGKYESDMVVKCDKELAALGNKAKYDALITEADGKFKSEEWQNSINKYQEALKLYPDEKYPAEQIKKAAASLKQAEANSAEALRIQKEYDAKIAAAQKAESENKLDQAIQQYKAAGQIKPSEELPPRKVTELEGILADRKAQSDKAASDALAKDNAAKEALEAEYKKMIEEGDAFYSSKDYANAKSRFNRAKELKNLQYEKDMLARIEKDIAESGKRGEYDAIIAEADASFNSGEYAKSIEKYKAALKLYGTEKYPTEQMERAELALRDKDKADREMAAKRKEYEKKIGLAESNEKSGKLEVALQHYKAAGEIIPSESLPPAKIAEIQGILADRKSKRDQATADSLAKLEAERSALETQYMLLIEEGDDFYQSKDYDKATDRFQIAKKLKNGAYETEMLAKILEAKAAARKRIAFDSIVTIADGFYASKDYAISIEKYREASLILPPESYPKDQVVKAEEELKKLLGEEADRQRIEREYKMAMDFGDKAGNSKNYEEAILHFEEAARLKSAEPLPLQKITEMQSLIAERDAQINKERKMKEDEDMRLETEYQGIIAAADQMFSSELYLDARSRYEEAIALKSDASYPRSKIEAIELILSNKENERLVRERALQDSLALVADAERVAFEEQQKLLEEQALEVELKRKRDLEEKQRQEAEKVNSRKRKWDSDADLEAEARLEKYYREAAEKEYAAKAKSVTDRVEAQMDFRETAEASADDRRLLVMDELSGLKDAQSEMSIMGIETQARNYDQIDKKKKKNSQDVQSYENRAETRLQGNADDIEEIKRNQDMIRGNDRYRLVMARATEETKSNAQEHFISFYRKGESQRKLNDVKINREKKLIRYEAQKADEFRTLNYEGTERMKNSQERYTADSRKSADQRIDNNQLRIAKKKEDQLALTSGTDIRRLETARKINALALQVDYARRQSEIKTAQKQYDSRIELFEKNPGRMPEPESYAIQPGSEHLRQGVTENSYKMGNKTITERTVRQGNKVDRYKKVVSKSAIYYFHNGRSITEEAWHNATVLVPD
jgi:tetratricopeptide (TPR) repeat protein